MTFKHWIAKQEGKTLQEEPESLVGWLVKYGGIFGTRYCVVLEVGYTLGCEVVWGRFTNNEENVLDHSLCDSRAWVEVRKLTKIRYVGTDNL